MVHRLSLVSAPASRTETENRALGCFMECFFVWWRERRISPLTVDFTICRWQSCFDSMSCKIFFSFTDDDADFLYFVKQQFSFHVFSVPRYQFNRQDIKLFLLKISNWLWLYYEYNHICNYWLFCGTYNIGYNFGTMNVFMQINFYCCSTLSDSEWDPVLASCYWISPAGPAIKPRTTWSSV